MQIIGHRGARGLWPENTIGGFKNAIKAGVEAFELDCQLTMDGVLVVTHDFYIDPNTARYEGGNYIYAQIDPIFRRNYYDITTYDVGRINPESEYAKQFPHQQPIDGEHIPTLKDVLTLICGHAAVTIEVKVPDKHLQQVLIAKALQEVLSESITPWDDITISSFDWKFLTSVKRMIPDIPIAALMEKNSKHSNEGISSSLYHIKNHGFQIWSPEFTNLNYSRIEEAHKEGLKVITWTVNDWEYIDLLERMGVDGVITDYPIRPL